MSRTLAVFAAQLAAHLNTSDYTALGTDDLSAIATAANAGLQDFYAKAPAHLKKTPVGGILAAPATVSIGVTLNSAAFTVFSPTSAQIFQTIVINGQRNIIMPGGLLFFPFTGGATGTYAATIYGDVAVFSGEAQLDRLLGAPLLDEDTELALADGDNPDDFPQDTVSAGKPDRYRVDEFGQTAAARPWIGLRVWPLPAIAYRLRVDASITAFTLTAANLTSSTLFVPAEDRLIDRFILPLCLWHLMAHRLWKLPENRSVITAHYQSAMADLALLPARVAAPQNVCGTPVGY